MKDMCHMVLYVDNYSELYITNEETIDTEAFLRWIKLY